MDTTFWQAVFYPHLIAMAFFLGGQLLLATAIVPVLRGEENRDELRAVARRFGWGSLVALGVLIATGAAMASHLELWDDGTLHVKLALVALAVILAGVHLRYPRAHLLQAVIFLVTLAIVWEAVQLAN
jgi:peptidoglycan/LPS O-acetylase OafA/YrhL